MNKTNLNLMEPMRFNTTYELQYEILIIKIINTQSNAPDTSQTIYAKAPHSIKLMYGKPWFKMDNKQAYYMLCCELWASEPGDPVSSLIHSISYPQATHEIDICLSLSKETLQITITKLPQEEAQV